MTQNHTYKDKHFAVFLLTFRRKAHEMAKIPKSDQSLNEGKNYKSEKLMG
jgi:hypothetical protein